MSLYLINGIRIRTAFVYPPIPIRSCDWQAVYDNDEPNDDGQMASGEGATEITAILDLIDNNPRELCKSCGAEVRDGEDCDTRDCVEERDCECPWETVHSASIDPPERQRSRSCPVHGDLAHRDPDLARDEQLEDLHWDMERFVDE